ncbi:MAG TPA: glycosyltransferase [Terriglobales bacterium]|jgi:hypothetical protein|nr:glycosyltransferase [Terriglobales bacterium]
MNEPLISVVMVVRNVERFLAKAIESILAQTFTDFEFIIVDFGSTDNSNQIVKKYAAMDPRVRASEIEPCGLAEARNAGGFLARGRYIAIMDADDMATPERLNLQAAFLEKNPRVGVVGGATLWIDAAGNPLRKETFPTEDQEIKSALEIHCPFCQPSVLIRREAFDLVGGYRAIFAPAEDYDLWMRISEHYQCANLSEVLLEYRIHPQQVSFQKRTQQTLGCIAARVSAAARRSGRPDPLEGAAEINPALLTELGVSEATQQFVLADEYLCWVRNMSAAGEYASARKIAAEVLKSPDWEHVERWQAASMQLLLAVLYWKEKAFLKALGTACRAYMTRPVMLARPLKLLVSWGRTRLEYRGSQ